MRIVNAYLESIAIVLLFIHNVAGMRLQLCLSLSIRGIIRLSHALDMRTRFDFTMISILVVKTRQMYVANVVKFW